MSATSLFPSADISPESQRELGAQEDAARQQDRSDTTETKLRDLLKKEETLRELREDLFVAREVAEKWRRLLVVGPILFMIIEVFLEGWILTLNVDPDLRIFFNEIGLVGRIMAMWIPTILLFIGSLYATDRPVVYLRERILNLEDEIRRGRLYEDKPFYLTDELHSLTTSIARVFLENQESLNQANEWRSKADHILGQYGEWKMRQLKDATKPDLGEAESCIYQIKELMFREESELRAQRNWQFVAVGIMLIYILLLVGSVLSSNALNVNQPLPIFGLPLPIVMWGAAGSLAAILYRFYTASKRVRFDQEVRWLIARPIIGIIMAGVAYLAIVAGLVLLGANPAVSASAGNGPSVSARTEVYWIVAFLAGFSDKFYLMIINLLVDKTVGNQEHDQMEKAQPIAEENSATT